MRQIGKWKYAYIPSDIGLGEHNSKLECMLCHAEPCECQLVIAHKVSGEHAILCTYCASNYQEWEPCRCEEDISSEQTK